jgi:menaquinone-dependent protoporphyrinogen oxidase
MRVLVTSGSKHGGTEGIAHIIGDVLRERGFEVLVVPAEDVRELETFDGVIAGGGLYANRWPRSLRRFVNGNVAKLRKVPVWFFSSGPLDDSADRRDIPPANEVVVLAQRVGAKSHVTFGGRLEPDVRGFPASAMAQNKSGDWRNPARVRAWASELASLLPDAVPGEPVEPPARSIPRLVAHGLVGWALCGATMGVLLQTVSLTTALAVHAIAAPVFFTVIAWHYFRARGAREPLTTALTWTGIVALADLVIVGGVILKSFEMFASVAGTWLPFALIFIATWVTGEVMAMLPSPGNERTPERRAA